MELLSSAFKQCTEWGPMIAYPCSKINWWDEQLQNGSEKIASFLSTYTGWAEGNMERTTLYPAKVQTLSGNNASKSCCPSLQKLFSVRNLLATFCASYAVSNGWAGMSVCLLGITAWNSFSPTKTDPELQKAIYKALEANIKEKTPVEGKESSPSPTTPALGTQNPFEITMNKLQIETNKILNSNLRESWLAPVNREQIKTAARSSLVSGIHWYGRYLSVIQLPLCIGDSLVQFIKNPMLSTGAIQICTLPIHLLFRCEIMAGCPSLEVLSGSQVIKTGLLFGYVAWVSEKQETSLTQQKKANIIQKATDLYKKVKSSVALESNSMTNLAKALDRIDESNLAGLPASQETTKTRSSPRKTPRRRTALTAATSPLLSPHPVSSSSSSESPSKPSKVSEKKHRKRPTTASPSTSRVPLPDPQVIAAAKPMSFSDQREQIMVAIAKLEVKLKKAKGTKVEEYETRKKDKLQLLKDLNDAEFAQLSPEKTTRRVLSPDLAKATSTPTPAASQSSDFDSSEAESSEAESSEAESSEAESSEAD